MSTKSETNGSLIRLFSLFILSPFTRISELSTNNNNIHVKVSDKDMAAIQDLVLTFCPKETETLHACTQCAFKICLRTESQVFEYG